MFDERCKSELSRILGVFESLGYPRGVVTQWSLPAEDSADLWRICETSRARRILEVGSFVGTSAFLMATALPDCTVDSVDPNLPLEVEFAAMGSADRNADLARRTLEIARASASRLGVSERVRFHEGGFAVGDTIALSDVPVPVIGPALCAARGPFDLVFVDGLHFEEAVVADLRLALHALAPHGTIAMHDAIGYWGSHVRRAVHRVLEENPGLVFRHAPYVDLMRGIGTLSRTAPPATELEPRLTAAFGDLSVLASHLARLLRARLPGVRVDGCDAVASSIARCMPPAAADAPRLLVAAEPVDSLDAHEQEPALGAMLADRDAALLGFSPPGEENAAAPWAQPLSTRVRQLDRLGFDAYDLIYPFLEPYTHPFGGPTALSRRTSAMMDAVVAVRRSGRLASALGDSTRLDPARARAISELRLQILFSSRNFEAMRRRYDATHASLHRLAEWPKWRIHVGKYHFWRRPASPA